MQLTQNKFQNSITILLVDTIASWSGGLYVCIYDTDANIVTRLRYECIYVTMFINYLYDCDASGLF